MTSSTFLYKIRLFFLFLCLCSVMYFSWLPQPDFQNEHYLPLWLIRWSSTYGNLRTAVPFVLIGFLLHSHSANKKNVNQLDNGRINFIFNTSISAFIISVAEVGQFFIHSRSPDLMDIFFGVVGSVAGGLIYYFIANKI